MKERPILFSAPMVRAILDGKKTQTRRICKDSHVLSLLKRNEPVNRPHGGPYGAPGDRLWVRETWQPIWADGVTRCPAIEKPDGWAIGYPATDGIQEYHDPDDGLVTRCKPGIHMPRWASRITLEVTGVRVERLHAITDDDARAEGVVLGEPIDVIANGEPSKAVYFDPRTAFAHLWCGINGAESWKADPWVWVVEFRRLAQEARSA